MDTSTDRFLNYLKHEKRSSAHTVVSYTTDLTQFTTYLSVSYELHSPLEATHLVIRSWIVSLMEQGMDPRSVNRKITTLRTYYKYMVRVGELAHNPMLKVQAPKTRKKLPEYVDEQRMDQLFANGPVEEEGFAGLRDQTMLDFFYRTGVRLSELIGLKLKDVNLHALTVTVLGKRNKVRQIPLTMTFRDSLREYLAARRDFLAEAHTESDAFFVDNKGNPMSPTFVYRIVKQAVSKVSTGKKRSPHVLRHSFATAMLNHGADINAIKELLGHSSLAATQVYTHNSIEKLKEVYKQPFPKA
jgi:integrase/recombinase XerC